MRKALIVFLSFLLLILLLLSGFFLFLFSPTGDAFFKPYIKRYIEQKSGMNVVIPEYQLRAGSLKMTLLFEKRLQLRTVANYSLFPEYIKGVYRLKTKGFRYGDMRLDEADIKGAYEGTSGDLTLDGKGTAMHAPATYRMRFVEGEVKQLEAKLRGLPLEMLLAMAKQPALAKGKVDVDVSMPQIGSRDAKGSAVLHLKKVFLNHKLIRDLYGMEVPPKSRVEGRADAALHGEKIDFAAKIESALFACSLKEGHLNTETKQLSGSYVIDIKEMRLFSQNRLQGSLLIHGKIAGKEKQWHVTGESRSLGGVVAFDVGDAITMKMKEISVPKLLHFAKQPAWMSGKLNGSVKGDRDFRQGSYTLAVSHARLNAKVLKKQLGVDIPPKTVLVLHSKGTVTDGNVQAVATVDSPLATLKLSQINYDIAKGVLKTPYRLSIADANRFAKIKNAKKLPVDITGKVQYGKGLALEGKISGLGETGHFSYDGKRASLKASGLYVERVLRLLGLPVYLRGETAVSVNMHELSPMEGSFRILGKQMWTDPVQMKKLIGKAAKIPLSLSGKGEIHRKRVTAEASLKSSLGDMTLTKIKSDLQSGKFSSVYTLKIPDMQKLQQVIDVKLYGALALSGTLAYDKYLKITGVTRSLKGEIRYTLTGTRFRATLKELPLPNLLGLMGYPQSFLGTVSGTLSYDLAGDSGSADAQIAAFRIKPGKFTDMLKAVLKKDPSRIIYKTTTLKASIKPHTIAYTLEAKGTRSTLSVTQGRIDRRNGRQQGNIKFVYEKYTIYGKLAGTTQSPRFILDTSKLIKGKVGEKLQKKLEKSLGKDAGRLLKAFGL
ncbi:MAG: hypothetical protein L3J47_05550 [Sulfurovum sp.]|nr:hypothetical protein [Sulfurovum sp.]